MGSAFFGSERNDCQSVEERLDVYLTGALPEGEERSRITAHLSDCPECRGRVVEYTRVGEALSSYRAAPLPERPGDWRMVRARLETSSERRLGWRLPVFGGRAIVTGVAAVMVGFVAVALPRLNEAESAPIIEPAPTPPPVTNTIPQAVASTITEMSSISRVMGFVTVGEGENTLAAAPTFVGTSPGTVVPLVIEVGSDREVSEAHLEIRPQRALDGRLYRYDIRLENGRSRFLVYPSFNPTLGNNGQLQTCEVTLTAPGRRQTARLFLQSNPGSWGSLAYVGNHLSAITPRVFGRDPNKPARYPNVRPNYVAVENAPDRAVGYSNFNMVVLSPEAARMTPAQWQAIREWVTAGGHLVLTSEKLLDIPIGAELAPVRKVTRKAFGTNFVPIPGAIEKETRLPETITRSPATITRRYWGLGTVFFTSFNPATEEFRRWEFCDTFWDNMLADVRSRAPQTFRTAGHHRTISNMSSQVPASENAFALALPSVQFVFFLFLGYFVLAVPVTFAVLKHTRRLNLAWVTGPVLAIVFAGGIFLLTARLYFMPTARRTAGVVFLHSGERSGWFAGNTELFFPKAGRYDLPISQADSVETTLYTEDRERPLDSRTNIEGDTTATLSVGNLAFRRIHQEQSVDFPGAVTVELQENKEGELVGFAENNTGKPLLNAILSDKFTERIEGPKDRFYVRGTVKIYQLGTLPAGRTMIHTTPNKWVNAEYSNADYLNYSISNAYRTMQTNYMQPMPQHLVLMAHIPGETFGPRIGEDVSGERSVSVVVGVNAQKAGGK